MVRSTALMQHDRSGPDPARIAALSVAILANLTIFAFLMQPMSYTLPAETKSDVPVQLIRHEKIEPLRVPVDQTQQKRVDKPQVQPVPIPHPNPHPRVNVVTSSPGPMSQPVPPDAQPSDDGDTGPVSPPVTVQSALTPIDSPAPPYPRDAMRDGITGTVLLELTVGTDGSVIKVDIVHGSGNRHLDEAARDQVLRSWRFRPAVLNGVPVQALGRVPIVFRLDGQP